MTEEQKQAERIKAQQYAELMNIPYVDPFPEEPTPVVPSVENSLDDLSDAQLLEILNKRTGAVLSNLNDLKPKPTPAEIAAQEQERQTAMLTYGLSQGKFKKEEYDAYNHALANKMSVVREDVKEQFTVLFPELSPDAIEEKVALYLFENLDPADNIRQTREKELIALSEMKIKDKYKNIVNLPTDYAQYEEGLNKQVNFEKKVQATLPVYQSDVKRALQSLKSFSVPVADSKNPANTVNVNLQYDDKDLAEVEEQLLSNDQIIRAVKEGYTFEQLKEMSELVLWKKHGPRLISQAAKQYNTVQKEGYLMGRLGGIPSTDNLTISSDGKSDLDKIYDEILASDTK